MANNQNQKFETEISAGKMQELQGKPCITIGLGSSIFNKKRGLADLINKYSNFNKLSFTPAFWQGVGGARVTKVQKSFLEIITNISQIDGCKSQIIFLYLGGNDFAHEFCNPEQFRNDYLNFVKSILEIAGTKIVVCSILPRGFNPRFPKNNTDMFQGCYILENLCASLEHTGRVMFLNLLNNIGRVIYTRNKPSLVPLHKSLLFDNTHLSFQGNIELAKNFVHAFNKLPSKWTQ